MYATNKRLTFLINRPLSNADVDLMVDNRIGIGNGFVLEVRPKLFDHFQEFPVGPRLVDASILLYIETNVGGDRLQGWRGAKDEAGRRRKTNQIQRERKGKEIE